MSDFRIPADEFFREQAEPDKGDDVMNFAIERARPESPGTFSSEALDGLLFNATGWVTARILSRWRATGEPPRKMTVQVRVTWDVLPEDLLESTGLPWWSLGDRGEGLDVPDFLPIEEERRREAAE